MCNSDQFTRIHTQFWNSPESYVSVIQDWAANGSLHNVINSVGGLPESMLMSMAEQILRALDFMHSQNLCHSNIRDS
jgi:serine/threonine protein kinase